MSRISTGHSIKWWWWWHDYNPKFYKNASHEKMFLWCTCLVLFAIIDRDFNHDYDYCLVGSVCKFLGNTGSSRKASSSSGEISDSVDWTGLHSTKLHGTFLVWFSIEHKSIKHLFQSCHHVIHGFKFCAVNNKAQVKCTPIKVHW